MKTIKIVLISLIIGSISGATTSYYILNYFGYNKTQQYQNSNQTLIIKNVKEESAVVDAVDKASPAVVSIIVTKDLPVIERYYDNPSGDIFDWFFGGGLQTPRYRQKGTQKQEIGGGTGFIVSSDGYIVTNKHVVEDEDADYTVLLNNEEKIKAEVLARSPYTDLAVLKIESDSDLPMLELGDSSDLKVGQTVIAIGNSLGEFRNTVSTGVISGLSRSIVAGSLSSSENLMGLIQTDASINPGNSGGPLLDISGRVIGINTAMAQGAENIGFAIQIDEVKNTIENVKENGKIVRPWLGVRYIMVNDDIAQRNNLDVDYGAIVVRGEERSDLAVIPNSPASKAGIKEEDIILEVDGEKVDNVNPLYKILSEYDIGDELELKIKRNDEDLKIKVVLEEMEEN